ncbi:sugar phosphate isomerase/epimerase family protein [Jannaschia aquimarina]|uniref:D-tagatose 3-epimerase n=1 Tax=Jannaschia aquimarina TaxID=935700 RepID=A0A0D1CJM8_9RHOB|nr:sugar phosphate isomerase/epimerase [Jannaschia aquimarina]KIT14917.1 D-tagatose 3-epimerase [Jannaschia aquimarina]SNS59279.1 D-psicose/D-tagatose/L-ribulose 3-epimerase [Jannaschia aquimarina]
MKGFGVHTSMWTMSWDRAGAERAVAAAVDHGFDFIEIALLSPDNVDPAHSRGLLQKAGLRAVCSLGLPQAVWPSRHGPEGAVAFLTNALDVAHAMGAEALSGVTFGGIGETTGAPPTAVELDNAARTLDAAAAHAAKLDMRFGIEPVNRYETHLLNTARQGVEMIERVGAPNLFLHLDTYHMNIEERGMALGILEAREHLAYIHLSESDRGTPGAGNVRWDEVYGALAAIGFEGGLAMESFIDMPPEIAHGLAVWRPVAESRDVVLERGLPFLRNKAIQYGLWQPGD